jgi:competence protein ComEA
MPRPGTTLCVVLLLAWFSLQSRQSSVEQQGPPAFFVEKEEGIRIAISEGLGPAVVRQFTDGTIPLTAIHLTAGSINIPAATAPGMDLPLRDGEALQLLVTGSQVAEIHRYWMPARWRMSLGILLHPDQMSEKDWQALPGIGPKLAAGIELDRQKNGDFFEFQRLQRVRGIGPKRMHEWEIYFYSSLTDEKSLVK